MEKRIQQVFMQTFNVTENVVSDELKYSEIPQWDSVAHMSLIVALEDEFDIMIDTDDVIDMSSFKKAKEIVAKYLAG